MAFRRFATVFIHIVDFQLVAVLRIGDRFLYVVRRHRPAHIELIRRIAINHRRCYAVIRLIRKRLFVTFSRFATVFILIVDRQLVAVLRVVEVKHVLALANRERRFLTRHQRVARDLGVRVHSIAERRSSCYGVFNLFLCSFQIIVYRVSGGVLFIVERQLALVFCEIDGLLFRVTIYKIERIEIFLQGIRRCNFYGIVPHMACLFIRMNQFFSIIIDIFDRINGRKLLNINRSVHVPCIRSRRHIIIRAIVNIEFRPCNLV